MMTQLEIDRLVYHYIGKGSQKLTDYLYKNLHFDFRRLNAIVQDECGMHREPAKKEQQKGE